jgi:hypothetical protein
VILANVRQVSRESRLMFGAEIRGIKRGDVWRNWWDSETEKGGGGQIFRKLWKIFFKLFSDMGCRKDLVIQNVKNFRYSRLWNVLSRFIKVISETCEAHFTCSVVSASPFPRFNNMEPAKYLFDSTAILYLTWEHFGGVEHTREVSLYQRPGPAGFLSRSLLVLPESFPVDYRQCTPGLRRDREMPGTVTSSPQWSISVCNEIKVHVYSGISCIHNEAVTTLLYIFLHCLKSASYVRIVYSNL